MPLFIKDIVKGELDTKCSSLSFVLKTGVSVDLEFISMILECLTVRMHIVV